MRNRARSSKGRRQIVRRYFSFFLCGLLSAGRSVAEKHDSVKRKASRGFHFIIILLEINIFYLAPESPRLITD